MERLNECPFCNGKNIPAQYVGKGQRTMLTNLNLLFGGSDDDSGDGIRLENGNLLAFQNSSGEYAEQMIAISYCPFCGERLKEGRTMLDNDLVSRAVAIDALTDTNLKRYVDSLCDGDMNRTRRAAQRVIAQLPAVDAAPVVHAHWWYEDLDGIWLCSHCNSGESVDRRKYCPDCGARMDADEPTCGPDYCEIDKTDGGKTHAEHRRVKMMEHELRPVEADIDDAYYEYGRKHQKGAEDDD